MQQPPRVPEETLRLHQANERTVLARIRTDIALMAFSFAIARFGVFSKQVANVGQDSSGDVGAPRAFIVYVFGITATLVGLVMIVLLVRPVAEWR